MNNPFPIHDISTGHVLRAALMLVVACFGAVSSSADEQDTAKTAKGPAAKGPAAGKVEIDPLDWPVWRGPEYNGISRETGLPDDWDPAGPNLKWKSADAASRSTPIIMRGKLYVLARAEPGTSREGGASHLLEC